LTSMRFGVKKMLKVAVTGGAGAGKTLVCECFRRIGAHVINLDELAREAVQPGSLVLKAIADHFGEGVLRSDGSLNRGKLRAIITRDAQERRFLEGLTHPEIFRLLEERVSAVSAHQEDAVVIVEVPLLIELGMQDQFDVVILVEAGLNLQERRLMLRDRSSERDAQALIGIQMAAEKKRPYADFIVQNQGLASETEAAVRDIYEKIRKST